MSMLGQLGHLGPDASAQQRRASTFVLAMWIVYVGLSLVCLALLLADLRQVVHLRAFAYGVLFAAAPAPFLAVGLISLDRWRPEPGTRMAVALIWGVCVATFISLKVNGWLIGGFADDALAPVRGAVFVAPWVEEAAKGVIVLAIVWWQRHRFMSGIGGVIYGGLVGVGFAFTENIVYYSQVFQQAVASAGSRDIALDAVQDLFWWRGVAAPFVHPMFTGVTGLGLAFAIRQRHLALRVLACTAGFLGAVVLHMGYNTLATFAVGRALTAVYVGILLPLVLTMLLAVFLIRRHDRRVLNARLHDYVVFGWLSEEEVSAVATGRGRRALRRDAMRAGSAHYAQVKAYQRLGMELGGVRDRIVRRVATPAETTREMQLLHGLAAWRGRWLTPGNAAFPVGGGRTVGSRV